MWVKPFRQSNITIFFLSAYKIKPLYLFHLMNFLKELRRMQKVSTIKLYMLKKVKGLKRIFCQRFYHDAKFVQTTIHILSEM